MRLNWKVCRKRWTSRNWVAEIERDFAIDRSSKHTSSLMPRVREGNRTAFEDLYRRYALVVAAYFRPYVECTATVDDLTQEVFSRLWHKRARYRPGTPDLPYLRGFAEYVLKNHQDEHNCKLSVRLDYDLRSVIDTTRSSPLDRIDLQERIQIIRNILVDLPEKQRQALVLTYVEDLSSREAADEMGCSTRAVRSYCCRGLAQLRQWFETHNIGNTNST